jgi:glycosyltransferase involved in cell wall biosynthesis
MNSKPIVSVIMPAFNVAPFIGEAIESVLRQSLEDWELIVVNDGSTDGTPDAVRRFEDSRIRLIEQPNEGVSSARNKGMKEACGQLIVFLDADDRMLHDTLARFAVILRSNRDAVAAYGEGATIEESGAPSGVRTRPAFAPRPSGDALLTLLGWNFILTGGIAIRAETLRRLDGFRSDLTLGEDWEMWTRVAAEGPFAYMGPKPLVEYRMRESGAARTLARKPDEMFRVVDAVFSNPRLRDRLSARQIAAARKKQEAAALSYAGTEHLKAKEFSEARKTLLRAIGRAPLRLREWILFGCAVAGCVPGVVAKRLK